MLRHFLNPPNWFTSASMFCGLYSIVLATGIGGEQNLFRAALMIMFAGVFDTFDGTVARITKTGSRFGMELDSLADVISFGVAPALLLYSWGAHELGVWGLIGATFFMLCGTFRLARFNIETTGVKETFSRGLTITMAGGTVAAFVLWHASSAGNEQVAHPWNVFFLAVAMGFLMVSSVPYRGLKSLKIDRWGVIVAMLIVAGMLTASFFFQWSLLYLLIGGTYVLSGPVELLIRRDKVLREAGIKAEDLTITAEDFAEIGLEEVMEEVLEEVREEAPVEEIELNRR